MSFLKKSKIKGEKVKRGFTVSRIWENRLIKGKKAKAIQFGTLLIYLQTRKKEQEYISRTVDSI